jgi:uncharacterized integral membrane protein
MTNVVILLVIVTVIAVISVQNATPVVIAFLFWKFETNLAMVIFLSLLAGLLMAAVIMLSRHMKRFLIKRKDPKP